MSLPASCPDQTGLNGSTGHNFSSWIDGLIDAGISRVPPHDDVRVRRPRYFGTPAEHLQRLEDGRSLLKAMSRDPRIAGRAKPCLSHPELEKRHIFVSDDDPTKITSFIDWQSACVEPAFSAAAKTPDFAQEYPEAFSACVAHYLPSAVAMDARLSRPFEYVHRTWNDGLVAFEHDLIETSKEWSDLGFQERCPVSVPEAEIADHDEKYQLFAAAVSLREHLKEALEVTSDGWVPPDKWDATQSRHQELYHGLVQALLMAKDLDNEPIRGEKDLQAIWPFDLEVPLE